MPQRLKVFTRVWEYSIVPGGLEAIIRNLGLFSNTQVQIVGTEINRLNKVKNTLSKEVLGNIPTAMVLGGPDDGKIFMLGEDQIRIGRIDSEKKTGIMHEDDIVLSEGYTAVTRISKPHGRFIHENDEWYIEDCGSTGGTRINHKRLEKNTKIKVHDGDLIDLAKGISGVKLLVIIPQG